MRQSEWSLDGWVEPADAAAVRAFYRSVIPPLLASGHIAEPSVAHARRYLIDKVVWGLTTLTDRRRFDLRYVSAGAKALYAQLDEASSARRLTVVGRQILPQLRHEHVIERKEVIERILARGAEALDDALACVVTSDEHRLLGKAAGQGWDRYRAAGVAVWDRQVGDWLIAPPEAR